MGRPPCCEKVGIKKGPWTPEEDIILVSYIQEHGPGNWRSVPTNTGLSRCSKSCRLRWTNYLRPGIKRGNFTPHEEGMIIHLQALLGNKWAAIASYLPQRTDNDIKNYWNTHLKKKLKKQYQSNLDPQIPSNSAAFQFVSKMSFSVDCRSTRRTSDGAAAPHAHAHDHENGKPTHHSALLRLHQQKKSSSPSSSPSVYASSEENISRLLEGWMRSSPKKNKNNNGNKVEEEEDEDEEEEFHQSGGKQCYRPHDDGDNEAEVVVCCKDELDSFLSFENLNSFTSSWDKSSSHHHCTVVQKDCDEKSSIDNNDHHHHHQEMQKSSKLLENNNNPAPPPAALSFLENWLLEESMGQVEEGMEIPSIF